MYRVMYLYLESGHIEYVAVVVNSDPQPLSYLTHAGDGAAIMHTNYHWVIQIPAAPCIREIINKNYHNTGVDPGGGLQSPVL